MQFQFKRSTLTAVAATALSLTAALAAPVPAPVSGDVYIGFRAAGGVGGSSSYIVKIGQDTVFRSATAGSTFTVTGLGNIGADLTATYGAGWATRADLFWSVFGVRPSAASILYASKERSNTSVPADSWPELDVTSRNTTASQITSVLESIGGYKGLEATSNSPVAALQPNSPDASSYNKQVATAGTNDFGSLSEWTSVEGGFGGGTSGTALDLFRIAGSGVTRVGRFSLDSNGAVTFTASGGVTPAPVIDTQPQSVVSFVGGVASFSVAATGSNLAFQWKKGTTNLTDGNNIAGATSSSLSISNLQSGDAGSYSVVVSNEGGSTPSNAVTLTVDAAPPAPVITSSTTATGRTGSVFSYQITANNVPTSYGATGLPSGLSVNTSTGLISGTPTAQGVSQISLSATNSSGTGTGTLTLTVNTFPTITTGPAGKTLTEGDSVTFSVAATGGNLSHQWRKDGVDLEDGPDVSGSMTATLTINNSKTTDAGEYTVVVTNTAGDRESSPASLQVNAIILNPDIRIEQPVRTNLVDGRGNSSFGYVLVGSAGKTLVFALSNPGDGDLTGIKLFRTGANASDFTVTPPTVTTLAPGASTTFRVLFKPAAVGARKAAIQVLSNDADESPFDIVLAGKGVKPAPEISVFQPAGSALVDGRSRKGFGTVKRGQTGAAKTFIIKNDGNAPLNGLATALSGKHARDFVITRPLKSYLPPGASTTFKVSFMPSATGNRNAILRIRSNDENESPFDINLSGAGASR